MKKLIIKIGNETHELPYNGEMFSFEVSEKYVPKAGDCVMVKSKISNLLYWCKITDVTSTTAYFKILVNSRLHTSTNGFFVINEYRIYTKITPEELKAKYAEAGYDWDYKTDTIKQLKWMPKDGDKVWSPNYIFKPINHTFYEDDTIFQLMLKKGLLFKTKEECQKFSEYCLKYFEK